MDKLKQKSSSMASKRGHRGQKIKMAGEVQFWNLIINVIHGNYKNAKNIQKIQLGEATQA